MTNYLNLRKILFFLFTCTTYLQTQAQTFIGISSAPTVDNGSQGGNGAVSIVPPASMQAGDLVVVYAHYRNNSGTFSINSSAGQTWNAGTTNNGANQTYFIAWCVFNGTWSGNPAVAHSGNNSGVPLTAVMYVYRPSTSNSRWGVNVTQVNSTANSATQSIAGVTTSLPNTVTMAFWSSDAAHTWGSLTGAGWAKPTFPSSATQVRNTTGSDISHTAAYKIMSSAGATGNVQQSPSSSANTVKSIISWYELSNDNCSYATPVTVNTGATCSSITTATTTGATQSIAGCNGAADDDVWFSFIATNNFHTISATGTGSPALSNPVIEVFSACGGSSIVCSNTTTGATESFTLYELTVGATYYYRVYSNANGSGQGNFTTCVATPADEIPASVATGKSFINITRPGGGTIVPGDELEIRVSVNVSNAGTNNIFRLRYNDTLPTNLTYVPGSLKLLTNEGKQYAAYTDAGGDDAAMYNGVDRTIRFNLGRDTTNMPRGIVSSTATDSTSGGYVRSNTHAPRGNGMLVLVTYRVIVDASTPYNTIINYGPGALRYRNMLNAGGAIDYTLAPNSLSFIIYPNYGLCGNATGANNVGAGNGDFGSGTAHNGPNPGAAVPGYTYLSITTGAPNDGMYSVVKNLSPSQSTNPYVARPENPNVDRVFRVWDIIGDHTGAADPLAGNPPPGNGVNSGYMLAVNAAYQLSIANNQTITGLCENTYYEFSAWFRNVCKRCGSDSLGRGASNLSVPAGYIPTAPGDSSGVKPNLTFMIDGVDYYTSGDMDYIGNYGQWVKKGFVFLTAPGQTSLTISIKNNAPGGGGNDWVMDDISFATCLPGLDMRPSNNPVYCKNGQVDMSVVVQSFYNNYQYYRWERSIDNGSSWNNAPQSPNPQSFSYTYNAPYYVDTVAYPSFIANPSNSGHKFRIRVGTTITNLANNSCAAYNTTDVITVGVHPTCDVLPSGFKNFNGKLSNRYAQLSWEVFGELPNTVYVIERSDNGFSFSEAGSVDGSLKQQYSWTDDVPTQSRYFYRIKMETAVGIKYSAVIIVKAIESGFEVRLLTNPFNDQITLEVNSNKNEKAQLQLIDMAGRVVKEQQQQVIAGTNIISIRQPEHLQGRVFVLKVIVGEKAVQKIVIKNQ
ncbi:putative repeat protein (TIGR01451 family)/predicted secreted protein (Por secretion system target) [Lacibacter cauensis]|uniref:Putative repeat protein (TIGR01451 family)/predicted secreted protein (Por secretion system target) n=1 Tax=Lacibacter cauensis TaxID=510947 RepID=A0A562SJ10_9BACT|nr:T9SS type A sorting domain-containing protein [Lacibacter cauensis]TWI81269.1 putative repeat protein (TIGR01451 family)/predicted secreted protein (Por secretion system target) [Lacibacter cauensis]